MRVLRVSHSAVVDEWRGRERALTALGVDVELCCARRWHAGGAPVTLQARPDERVRGVRTLGRHPALFLYDPIPLWRALGGDFDVIDVHEEPFALATAEILLLRALRKRARRTPVVLYTAQNLRKRYPIPFRWLERRALRAASGVSACNSEAARIAEDKGFVGRARVIPLGVDLERFRPADAPGPADAATAPGGRVGAPAPYRDPAPPITVGFIGRLVPEKGLLLLLDALAREPRLRLRVAGTGPLASELPERAASAGVSDRVELVGAVDPADIPEVLRSFDVLAVPSLPTPSWTEQFGRVAIEAMACGVPVVASDAGALPDVVGGAGIVVPTGDAAALAEALVEASGSRAAALREAGFARAEECSWGAVGRDYLDLYRSIVHEASVAPEPTPTLEVIVVAYGSPELLRRALEPVAGLPVTVVDNSSLPAIRELCDELGVRYLDPGRNGGFAAGVNHGLANRIAPGADVLLLNPDAEISVDDVARLHRALRARPDLASVGPAQVDDEGREARVEWWLPSPSGTWLEALGLARLRRDPSYVIGSVMLLRAEALEQVGWFDEQYFLYAEEADWAYRAHRLGWRHAVVPEARAVHVGAGTGGDPRRREAHFHASQERFLRKHFGTAGWQWARAGQWLGATVRSIVLPGERGRAARRRAALYRLGPVRVEARFRRADASGSESAATVRRIALVTSSYAPHFGGVEEHVRQVAHELSQRPDTVVEVWSVDRGEHLGTRDVDGVVVRHLPTPLPARNLRSLLSLVRTVPSAWLAWSRARRSFRPELLHVHCFGPNGVYGLVLGRLWRLPIAVTSHGETSADDRGAFARSALLRRALRAAIARARFVTAPSEWVLDELRTSYGLVGGSVVPNGVATTVGRPDPAHRLSALDDPRAYFAAVGRLGPLKGFDLLLDAFADAGLPDDTRLLIGGDGPERGTIERRITDLGLEGRAELLGRLDPAQVDDVMQRSIAVAVPSRLEPFGIVALEAWRARAALIMTNRGGGPEFVHDGVDGLLVDPLDRDALADALRRIHDDAELRTRLARTGHARVPEFSWPGVAAAYRARYEHA
ncbi:glycosyltransferase [Agromyces bracchium]|uniref:D-inositol 3-phosphate glycosyltransferase n=1 Tax=Agromyces bracchium TaxID=88376 RepID=A0A6I3M457_9MICO|nr:glycosyltransferase [Agromyces bracchium]MTH66917.1 glycosyltransferase [Agromyces bracchium]